MTSQAVDSGLLESSGLSAFLNKYIKFSSRCIEGGHLLRKGNKYFRLEYPRHIDDQNRIYVGITFREGQFYADLIHPKDLDTEFQGRITAELKGRRIEGDTRMIKYALATWARPPRNDQRVIVRLKRRESGHGSERSERSGSVWIDVALVQGWDGERY